MLKISTIDTRSERRLVIEGRLIDPYVAELKQSWGTANQNLDGRKLVIDLSNATVISREAEDALEELMCEGARFSCCGVLNKYLVKRMAHRCNGAVARR